MRLLEVIERAVTDKHFAAQLKKKAEAAYEAGPDTDDWEELMKEFAETPEELARMKRPGSHGGSSVDSGTTTGTRTGTTNTTTTTTGFTAPPWVKKLIKSKGGKP